MSPYVLKIFRISAELDLEAPFLEIGSDAPFVSILAIAGAPALVVNIEASYKYWENGILRKRDALNGTQLIFPLAGFFYLYSGPTEDEMTPLPIKVLALNEYGQVQTSVTR